MKRIIFLVITLVILFNVYSQTLNTPNLQTRFKSDIITYVYSDDWFDIIPLQEDKSAPITEYGLNYQLFVENILVSINNFRREYGLDMLTLSDEISNYLTVSNLNGLPLSEGFTWGTYGVFAEYGYVSHFENKELKFSDYLFDVMSLDDDLFNDLINPLAKTIGVFFSQNYSDKTYDFMVLVK